MNNEMWPLATTGTRVKVPVSAPWNSSSPNSDSKFLRSWLVYDSQLDEDDVAGRPHWNMFLGWAAALCLSMSFWAGLGLLVARIWK